MHRLWFPTLLVFIALGLGACKRGSGPQLDDPAPQVELPDFRGKTWQLPGDLRGKVWLVRFWSLDCHLCDKDILLGLETLRQNTKTAASCRLRSMSANTTPTTNVGNASPN